MRDKLISLARWGLFLGIGGLAFLYLSTGLGRRPHGENLTTPESDSASSSAARVKGTVTSSELDEALVGIVADLDAEFARHWSEVGLSPAGQADWLTICRRLSLALVGSGLSLEEIRNLESLPEAERVAVHRERLLHDRRFADYWAERFARTFVGTDEGPFLVYRRRRFVTWLAEQIGNQQPYDVLIRRLITGKGYFTDRPEVNFITVTMNSAEEGQPNPIHLAGRTTRAFLGMRIDCLQCHDDFLGNLRLGTASDTRDGTQQDFHQLAAFFSDSRFNILKGIRYEPHPYEYQYLDADEKTVVEPAVPFEAELLPAEGEPADRLAQWITHPVNRQSRRAFANRVWALMFGQPLHAPVDDIPLHGPLPPALDRLADAVGQREWSMRDLVRIISSTQAFRMASVADFDITPQHEAAWAVFPLIRLRPEQVARGVIQASRLTTINDNSAFILQLMAFGAENDFVTRYGDTGEDEFSQDNITITQRLLMMNGDMVRERSEANPVLNATSHIHMFAKDDSTAVETVYLAVLNRKPTEAERTHFVQRLGEGGNRAAAIEDLYWVLMNSSEMVWNH
jgi:hypothetical protein